MWIYLLSKSFVYTLQLFNKFFNFILFDLYPQQMKNILELKANTAEEMFF